MNSKTTNKGWLTKMIRASVLFLGMIGLGFVGKVFFAKAYAQANTAVWNPSSSQSNTQSDKSGDARGPFLGSNPKEMQKIFEDQTKQLKEPSPQPPQTVKKTGSTPVSNKTPSSKQVTQQGQTSLPNSQQPSQTSPPSSQPQIPSNTNTQPGSTVPANQGAPNQPSNQPQDFLRGY